MATLEQILPEIRKGRRFRPHGDHKWETLDTASKYSFQGLVNCEVWELEPEPEVILSGGWEAVEQPNFGLKISMDGEFVGNMTHEYLDKLHVASLRIRGIAPTLDVDQLAEIIRRVDGKHSLGAGRLAEAILGATSGITAKGIPQDTFQFTGVDPDYVEEDAPMSAEEAWERHNVNDPSGKHNFMIGYKEGQQSAQEPVYVEPDFKALDDAWNDYCKSYSERILTVYKTGWDACAKAMKGEV